MRQGWNKAALAAPTLALLFTLGACGDRVENTEMPQAAGHPSVEINRQGEPGAAKEQNADARTGPTAIMGAAGAPALTEDQRIAAQVQEAIASDADLGAMKIDVFSEGGRVTLRGRAPDEDAREKATEVARNVSGVRDVDNLLTLG